MLILVKEITITLDGVNEDTVNPRTATLTVKSGQVESQMIEIVQAAGESEPTENPEAKVFIFDTVNNETGNEFGAWCYFSFEKGDIVGYDIGSEENDARWKLRTDCDIAFTRFYSRTNSGESRSGHGGAIEIGETNSNKEEVFNNLPEAPEQGYIADDIVEGMIINMPPPTRYNSGSNMVVNKWLDVSGNPPVGSPKVFAIKTAHGKYAKIYLKEYDNGIINMYYVYQSDGSPNLKENSEE